MGLAKKIITQVFSASVEIALQKREKVYFCQEDRFARCYNIWRVPVL